MNIMKQEEKELFVKLTTIMNGFIDLKNQIRMTNEDFRTFVPNQEVKGTLFSDWEREIKLWRRYIHHNFSLGSTIIRYKGFVFKVSEKDSLNIQSLNIHLYADEKSLKIFDGGYGWFGQESLNHYVEKDFSLHTFPIPKQTFLNVILELENQLIDTGVAVSRFLQKESEKESKKQIDWLSQFI